MRVSTYLRIIFLSIIGIIFILSFKGSLFKRDQEIDQVCFGNNCFNVEIVQDQEDRTRGLMMRPLLLENAGMLFIFPNNARHRFWMKDTLIPLDIIWMDHARRIVHIESNVPPCKTPTCPSYGPKEESLYVLEINAKLAPSKGIRVGTTADFRFIR